MNIEKRNKCLNELLRGEISAQETYQQVMEKVDDNPNALDELRRIHQDHVQAAELLRGEISKQGGQPETGSGAWGSFAQAFTGTAKLFGNKAALKALKEGEEHGLNNYRKALDEYELSTEDRSLIESKLMPLQQQHIQVIDRYANAV